MTFDLDPSVSAVLGVCGIAFGLIGVALAVVAILRLRRLRRALTLLQADDDHGSFVEAVGQQVSAVERLRTEVVDAQQALTVIRTDLADAIRHVAVVRYDAFGDMGGRMSFSAALLDDHGDGVVFSSINGRTETRTYAKGVQGGQSEASLSPEEEQAVGYARRGHGGG